jgi:hypothetical protein
MHTLWLSDKVFSMEFSRGDSKVLGEDAIYPAYTEWEHAEVRLRGQAGVYDRKDALSALNRAVLHRNRLLNEHYRFKAIPGVDPASKNLELLHIFGIARGSVLHLIRQLRNQVEHELHEPPDYELCSAYLDAVWYFLRSTDTLLAEITEDMHAVDRNLNQEIDVIISPPEWKVYIEGPINNAPVSFLPATGTHSHVCPAKIDNIFHNTQRHEIYNARINGTSFLWDNSGQAEFFAEVTDPEWVKKFAQKYFSIHY